MTGGMSGDLERRYRRVLRLLPGYYREQWEEDMVAAFLDTWLTGDPQADAYISQAAGPGLAEIASVVSLAGRLYLGGAGTPRRYFAWGQAVRRAVLALLLLHAMQALNVLVLTTWSRQLLGLQALTVSPLGGSSAGTWTTVLYVASFAWIAIFVTLALGHYRPAWVLAALASIIDLVALVQAQLAGRVLTPYGSWAAWVLLSLAPVLAMAAFHRDAPPTAGRPWLLALPLGYLVVFGPMLALEAAGHFWLPDIPGLCCILVALACLVRAPGAWSGRAAGSGVWSLALILLAADAAAYRIVSLIDRHDPHLFQVSMVELFVLVAAAAVVAPDAARAQAPAPAPPPHPQPG